MKNNSESNKNTEDTLMKTYPISECKHLSLHCAALVYLYQSPDNKVTIEGDETGLIEVTDHQGHLTIKAPSRTSNNVTITGDGNIIMGNVGAIITGKNGHINIDMRSKKMTVETHQGSRTFGRVGQVIIGDNVVYEDNVIFNVGDDGVVINMGNATSSDRASGNYPKIAIYCPSFPSIQVTGAVILQYASIKQDELELELSGSSIVNLDVLALEVFDLTCSGSSGIDIKGNIQKTTLNCSGSSDVKLLLANTAIKTKVNCSGNSTVTLQGFCDSLKAKCSGNSDIKAARFKTRNATVSASGNSDATLLKPLESLTHEARGNSDIDIV